MPYLIEHLACPCDDRTPQVWATAQEVGVSFWGREVLLHRVWAGECPYQFHEPDGRVIQSLLETCTPATVRDLLPCQVWAGSRVLVVIGWVDLEARQPLREVSYLTWLATRASGWTKG